MSREIAAFWTGVAAGSTAVVIAAVWLGIASACVT